MASLQLSPLNTIDVTLKTQNEIGAWVLDGTDKCGTVCHGMSRSLILIVSTEIMKIKIFYLENMGAERFERDWDRCYARGQIHIGFT